jgi:hypothetical protein
MIITSSALRCAMLTLGLAMSLTAAQPFAENGGLVVVEVESAPVIASWTKETYHTGYTGTGFYEWKKGDASTKVDPGGSGILSYPIKISTAGRYRLQIRSRPAANAEHNDVWVRVVGAKKFEKDKAGVATDLGTGWIKSYNNKGNQWSWDTWTTDHDRHTLYVVCDAATTIKIELSGRSTQFCIDRFVLYTTAKTTAEATSTTLPESPRDGGVPAEGLIFKALVDFPNIAAGEVPYYKDNANNVLAIDASKVAQRGKFARAERTFTGKAGTYDIIISTLGEVDGEPTFRVLVNGVKVGEYQNPRVTKDYDVFTKTFAKINVPANAVIAVESNTHSNGLIPEGTGFAWARGRWTQIELKENANVGPVNKAPNVNAGPDVGIILPAKANLKGSFTDDGLPVGFPVSVSWTKVSGPGTVTFTNNTQAITQADFSQVGTYVLRLTANDTLLQGSDEITITVADSGVKPATPAAPTMDVATSTLSGNAPAGATVTIVVKGPPNYSYNVTPNSDGTWSYKLPSLPAGNYSITTSVTVGGITSDESTPPVAYTATAPPSGGGGTEVSDNSGSSGCGIGSMSALTLFAAMMFCAQLLRAHERVSEKI